MNILILSCNTGGGHNAAANALAEEIRSHGDTATVLDYFCLADSRISHTVGNVYVEIVKKVPALFGFIYQLGMFVSRLVPKSPVYLLHEWNSADISKVEARTQLSLPADGTCLLVSGFSPNPAV